MVTEIENARSNASSDGPNGNRTTKKQILLLVGHNLTARPHAPLWLQRRS
jgi:hypothetical protein